jgi:ribonuclease HI
MNNSQPGEGIIDRRMGFCPTLQTNFNTNELITSCPNCLRFFVLCCPHYKDFICHHYRLVFTDGSCLDNGGIGATAGIGVAIGLTGEGEDQWSIAVDSTIDSHPKRTSQRAELLAALEGLRLISNTDRLPHPVTKKRHEDMCWVVATDSEYVVKGMSEWVRVWKVDFKPRCYPVIELSYLLLGEWLAHRSRLPTIKPRFIPAIRLHDRGSRADAPRQDRILAYPTRIQRTRGLARKECRSHSSSSSSSSSGRVRA